MCFILSFVGRGILPSKRLHSPALLTDWHSHIALFQTSRYKHKSLGWDFEKGEIKKNNSLLMGRLNWQILSSFLLTRTRTRCWNLSTFLKTIWPWIHDREKDWSSLILLLCEFKIPALDFLPANSLVREKNKALYF